MIQSILDNDLYKFTMQQAVHSLYPEAVVKYTFINRGRRLFESEFVDQLNEQIQEMRKIRLSVEEFDYLKKTCDYFSPDYLDSLKHYRYKPEEVTVKLLNKKLVLTIEGTWNRTILWEVPIMATISELYFRQFKEDFFSGETLKKNNQKKASVLKKHGIPFADFGTRRRLSFSNHEAVLRDIIAIEDSTLIGTSNVYMAKKFKIRPIGTQAHEWFMFHGALNSYRKANETALDRWTDFYKGALGIALTDTYTTEAFLKVFNSARARMFDGVRHDSGDPFEFTEKIIDHYNKLGIDPLSRTIVFSDGLIVDDAVRLQKYCHKKIQVSFGIGTHLTNDVGVEPLNMVIKLSHCKYNKASRWIPVVKLSDVEGKHTGNQNEIKLCLQAVQAECMQKKVLK